MAAPAKGAVVLVPFPFSEPSRTKLRPPVVLADAGRGDRVLCQLTSKPYGRPRRCVIDDTAFASGTLRVTSHARSGKTVHGEQRSDDGRSRPPHTESASAIVAAVVALIRAEIPTPSEPDLGQAKG